MTIGGITNNHLWSYSLKCLQSFLKKICQNEKLWLEMYSATFWCLFQSSGGCYLWDQFFVMWRMTDWLTDWLSDRQIEYCNPLTHACWGSTNVVPSSVWSSLTLVAFNYDFIYPMSIGSSHHDWDDVPIFWLCAALPVPNNSLIISFPLI